MSDKEFHDASDDGSDAEPRNIKKRKAVSEIKSSPAKKPKSKTKPTTLITQAPTGPHENYNADITKILAELGETEKNRGQMYKWRAYNTAIQSLKNHDRRIESGEEAKKLPGVGAKIAKKIQEIIDTGQLQRAEADRNDPLIAAMNTIAKVHGIGPKLAQKLVHEEGIRTIDDLRKRPNLTKHQQLGLKYFGAFEQKIPRAEMDKWNDIVKRIGHEIDPDLIVAVVGSYRRGLPSSGDVDVLLSHPKYDMVMKEKGDSLQLLDKMVKQMKEEGYILDDMSFGAIKYMGVGKLHEEGATPRHIDLKIFPIESFCCGLLHFTGSGEYNRQLRGLALEKGFKLSEYGIYALGDTGVPGDALPVSSEQDIFDILEVPYRAPEQRSL